MLDKPAIEYAIWRVESSSAMLSRNAAARIALRASDLEMDRNYLGMALHNERNDMTGSLDEINLETMESMTQRLRGTGGGAQADAVITAIKAIKGAAGMLDADNRATALYHLAVALSGESSAVDTIVLTAGLFETSC